MAHEQLARAKWIETALKRYEQQLLRYVLRMTGDLESARDVVQDAFLRLCKEDLTKVEDHVAAWLYTVCRNRALDVRKKEGRMGRISDSSAVQDSALGPGEMVANKQTLGVVLEVIESMSEDHQEAFRLKFQNQLTYREISEVMGKSLGTVSNLISTTLCAVRDRMKIEDKSRKEG